MVLVNEGGLIIESGKTTMTALPTPPEQFRPNPGLKLREQLGKGDAVQALFVAPEQSHTISHKESAHFGPLSLTPALL